MNHLMTPMALVFAALLLSTALVPTRSVEVLGQSEQAAPFTPALQRVAAGFSHGLQVTHAGDRSGRLFVVEKRGKIRIVLGGEVLPTPFLDVGSLISSSTFEDGLLGLAFHPNFDDPTRPGYRRFFVYYTPAGEVANRLASFEVSATDPNRADPSTLRVVLTIPRPDNGQIHTGGGPVFGPDGYLYLAVGDGGPQGDPDNNAQNKNVLLGKILRLDVDGGSPYSIPPTNPFVGRSDAREEIWAYGFRNPWRYSFDRATGDLWIGDVGGSKREEVNLQRAGTPGGQNFGWKIMEGTTCFGSPTCDQTGLTLPVTEYDHNLGCAVQGGYVYRGEAMPALRGAYIFGDYCTGRIWSLRQDATGSWDRTQLLGVQQDISSFGEDEAGELYLLDIWGGALYRFVDPAAPTPTGGPSAPTATPTATSAGTPTATSTATPTPTPASGSGADLVITAFSAAPAPSNRPIPVSVTLRNQGSVSTSGGEFDVHVFADLGRPPVSSDLHIIAHLYAMPLGPGASATIAGEIYPDSLEPGSHTLWALADAHETVPETDEGNNARSIPLTVNPAGEFEIVSFDDRAGENQPLDGEYPAGLIYWGSGQWYHAGPSGGFASKSLRFRYGWQTNVAFTFATPRRLASLQAYNSGSTASTISLACSGLPTIQTVLGAGQLGTLETGWTGNCGRVTVKSSNGPATLFDNLALVPTFGATTPTATATSGAPTPTPTTTPVVPTGSATTTATPTPTSGVPSGAEKLANPGFEEGLAGWVRPSWYASVADVETEVVRSGSRAFRFSGRASGLYLQQDVATSPGQTVTLSGWVYIPASTSTGAGQIELVALRTWKGSIATYSVYPFPTSTADWQKFSRSVVMPADTAWVRVQARIPSLNGTIFLDDFSLTVGDAPAGTAPPTPSPTAVGTPAGPTSTPTNVPTAPPTPTAGPLPSGGKLVNPGFEDGLTGWQTASWFAAYGTVQSDVVHSGTRAFRFQGTATGPYLFQDVAASPGQTVTVSIWVKATYASKTWGEVWPSPVHAHLKLEARTTYKTKIESFPDWDGYAIPPGDWTQVSVTAVMPPGTAWARLLIDFSVLDGTVYLDDFSLTSTGP